MGKEIMGAVVSLDGFIVDDRDDVRQPVGSAARGAQARADRPGGRQPRPGGPRLRLPVLRHGALAEPQLPTDPVRWGRQRCRVSTLGEQDRRTLLSV